jgi:hypothetical protein
VRFFSNLPLSAALFNGFEGGYDTALIKSAFADKHLQIVLYWEIFSMALALTCIGLTLLIQGCRKKKTNDF